MKPPRCSAGFTCAALVTALAAARVAFAQAYFNPANGHTYEFNGGRGSWYEGRDAAIAQGGYLATITSQAESDWLVSRGRTIQPPNGPYGGYWIGAFKQPLSDQSPPTQGWQWVTGESWSFTDWVPGEPNEGCCWLPGSPPESRRNFGAFNPFASSGGHWGTDSSSTAPSGGGGPYGYGTKIALIEYNGVPPGRIVQTGPVVQIPPAIPRSQNQTGLILVAHGWTPEGGNSVVAMASLKNAIQTRLEETGLADQWSTHFADWVSFDSAVSVLTCFGADAAGAKRAESVHAAGFTRVHLIGHSSGAWFINGLATRLRVLNPAVQIHMTFLDAHIPLFSPYSPSGLGLFADSVEHYYTEYLTHPPSLDQGIRAQDIGAAPSTRYRIPAAGSFNFALDSSLDDIQFAAGDMGDSHGFPIRWYQATLYPTYPLGRGGGWPLSPAARSGSVPPPSLPSPAGTLPPPIPPATNVSISTPVPGTNDSGGFAAVPGGHRLSARDSYNNVSGFFWREFTFTTTTELNFGRVTYTFDPSSDGVFGVWINGQPRYLGQSTQAQASGVDDVFRLPATLPPGTHTMWLSLESLSGAASVTISGINLYPDCANVSISSPTASTCGSQPASFSAVTSGTGPFTYQWQWQSAPGGAWVDIVDGLNTDPLGGTKRFTAAGARAATVTVSSTVGGSGTAGSHWEKRCIVTNVCGSVTSNTATLTICRADFNCDGSRTIDDIFLYINAWFTNPPDPRCDVDGIHGLTIDDLFVFINIWFAGC